MPKIASVVNNMKREYLIVYDNEVEGHVLALSPSLVRHGVHCAQKYQLDIPENLTYQQHIHQSRCHRERAESLELLLSHNEKKLM